MSPDDDRPDEAPAPTEGATNEEPPPAAGDRRVVARRLGEGGPSQITAAAAEPGSGTRPPRAPHLAESPRSQVVTEAATAERAIVTKAQRRRARQMELTRRQFVKASFWGGMGIGLTGSLAAFLAFFWPRGVQGFGGKIPVSASLVPEEGDDPVRVPTGKFWLSNLEAGAGTHAGFGQEGAAGLVALWWKCPHLGCTVPWRSNFNFEGVTGWFRCPCHGSTYTRAGVRVFGPAPRPMDTMEITVNSDGSLTVDTGAIRKGDEDNPQRAVPYDV